MNDNIAIKAEHLSKVYKIFNKPSDRVKEALNPFHKRYSTDFYALNDVSFEIKKGETLGIIGENGAGKSTLLKIITGVLTPTSGNIQVNGRIASLLELGAGFNPEMTGIENIYMNGTVMGYSKEEMDARLSDIVEFADIGDFINQPVKMYSSGMFARLAFAVNAFVEPDILIVDEALSVGDIFFQNKCFKKFEKLKQKGVTIILVSHDIASIQQLSIKTLWLKKGNIEKIGLTENVCTAYLNEEKIKRNKLNEDLDNIDKNTTEIVENKRKKNFPKISFKGEKILSEIVEIESLCFLDEKGKITYNLDVDKIYTVSMLTRFTRKIDNIIFGFVLENNKGLHILAINSFANNNNKLINISDTEKFFCANFKFKLPKIAQGEYIVSPAVARGIQDKHIVLTWITGALKVFINNKGYNISLLEIESNIIIEDYTSEQINFF